MKKNYMSIICTISVLLKAFLGGKDARNWLKNNWEHVF